MMKVSVMYITIRTENLILMAHWTTDRQPVIPTATSLGTKIKIFMIKVRKSFTCACTIIVCLTCACTIIVCFVAGNKYQNFKY